jgi:nucleoside-diphosphate-sugar epimerase
LISPPAKILVTGGTGFIGSYIIKELVEKGFAVRAIRRRNNLPNYISASIFQQVEWVDGDILDVVSLQEAMDSVDAVVHAAAIISFDKRDKKNMYQTNIAGTANIVNTALEKNIQRLVHISSVAALGRTAKGGHVTEEKKWEESNTNTAYAISKYRGEMEVWRGIAEGLQAVILNPSTVIGYGDWTTSSCRIFKSVYDEFPWYSTGVNGFVGVEDVAKAAVQLLETDISAERFIINSDNWSFQQLFNCIADGFGKKHPTRLATPLLAEIAWRMEKIKSLVSRKRPLLTRESARVANSSTYFENQKLRTVLPGFSFTPLEICIESACKKYLGAIKSPQA